jgi:hypothetical protein
MYVLYYYKNKFEVNKYQIFKYHEEEGAEYITEGDNWDELLELASKIKLI